MMFQQNGRDPSAGANLKEHLKGKTIEELRRELDVIFEQEEETGHQVDPALPAAYYEAMSALETQEPEEEAGFERSWAEFQKKHSNWFRQEASKKQTQKKRRRFRVGRLLEVAVLAAALMVLSAAAFRWPDYVASWGKERLSFSPNSSGILELNALGDSDYASLQVAVEDVGIPVQCAPQWIPEDYSVESIVRDDSPQVVSLVAIYRNSDAEEIIIRIFYYYSNIDMPDFKVETDTSGSDTSFYSRNDIDYEYSENYGVARVSWVDGQCFCTIIGGLAEEEMKNIVESIYWE